MKKLSKIFERQQGFVLVLALVMLTVLTLIGVSSMNSANLELRATANAKHHQVAFNAAQSLLEYTVSKPGTNNINYQTRNTTPVVYDQAALAYTATSNSSAVSATVQYINCTNGFGMSLEDGKGFGFNMFDVKGSASNAAGTAKSKQTLGVSYPAAPCKS